MTADHILTDTKPWGPCPKGCEPMTDAELRRRWQYTYGVLLCR